MNVLHEALIGSTSFAIRKKDENNKGGIGRALQSKDLVLIVILHI